jgi:hypothetical protein
MRVYKFLFLLILLCICSALPSCSFLDRYDPGFLERQQNLENIKKVKVGMTKQQVLAIMGEPLINEKYNKPNIWFYYTDWDWADCARCEEECTPIVFENGVVIGMGRVFYKEYSHKKWQFSDTAAKAYDTTGQEQ